MAALLFKPGIDHIKPHMVEDEKESSRPVGIALNSNESAIGASPHAIAAARSAVSGIERYLEDSQNILSDEIARRYDLKPEKIAIGIGSDDLLSRLARVYLDSGREMIRSRNGYLKAPNYAWANNAIPVSAEDANLTPSVDAILDCITPKTAMIYLANPENPAGTHLSGREIRKLHASLRGDILLVLDCAYDEYVDDPEYESPHLLVEEAANVVMTRTFSKIYGLAGARVGWMYAPEHTVSLVNRIGLTFPLSAPSTAAALAALQDTRHTQYVYSLNQRLRAEFTESIRNLGLKVYPSQTNFVLIEFPDPEYNARDAALALRASGISVRRFISSAYRECIRITLGFEHELKAAEGVIEKFLNGKSGPL